MIAAALQIIRHSKTISVSRFLVLVFPAVDPVFALIVEIICVRKSRKTRYSPFFHRPHFFLLRFFFLLRCSSRSLRANANTRNDTSFRGDFWSSCYLSLIGANTTGTGYKSDGNDFVEECWWYEDKNCSAPCEPLLCSISRICSVAFTLITRSWLTRGMINFARDSFYTYQCRNI